MNNLKIRYGNKQDFKIRAHGRTAYFLVNFSWSAVHTSKHAEQFSCFKDRHDHLSNKAPRQGKLVNFSAYTRATKACEGKIARLIFGLV